MGSEDDLSSRYETKLLTFGYWLSICNSDQSELTGDLTTSETSDDKPNDKSQKSAIDFMKLLRKKRATGLEHKTAELEEHEEKIKKIARDFCEWSNSLGEGGPNLGKCV